MQKKSWLKIVSSLTALTLMTSAAAQMSAPNGWYIEGNAGEAKLHDTSYGGNVKFHGVAFNLDAGYKFMPYFAAELGYTRYGTARVFANGIKAGEDRRTTYDIAGKAILPISTSGAEIFGKFGAARVRSRISISNQIAANSINLGSGSTNKNGFYLALGAQYYFIPELALNVQWARAQANNHGGKNDLYSAGLSFIFA